MPASANHSSHLVVKNVIKRRTINLSIKANLMHFILTAVKDDLAEAFEKHSVDLSNVTVHRGSIFDVDCDAVVSPANSFGFMDGGIDAFYCWRYGKHVQDSVRMAILRYWHGELPIGAAEIVSTEDSDTPYLIAAPTMRVPMILGDWSINPYLAIRASVILLREGFFREGPNEGDPIADHIERVAVPGMGTGVGKMPFDLAAGQMCEAIRKHSEGRHYLPKSWDEASETHQILLGTNPSDLQGR